MARRPAADLIQALPRGLVVVAQIVAACLVYLAVLDLTVIGGYALGQTVVSETARGTFGLLALGLAEAAALIAVLLVWRRVVRRKIVEVGLDRQCAPVRRWLRGALLGALMMGFVVLVGFTLVDGAAWSQNPDSLRAAVVLVGGLIGFAIQGPAEEVLFRGFILQSVRDEWGLRAAIVVSSVAFGLLHVANPAFGLMPLINLVLFGVGTALYRVYVDADQLWGVFAIHTLWNWLQQVVFGLPNSGISSAADATLFTVSPDTSLPELLWGGGFGPEGTLFGSLVLLALIVGALRARPKPVPIGVTGPPAGSGPATRRRSGSGRRRRG